MTNLTLREAQERLPELIHGMFPGEEFIFTEYDRPVARLLGPVAKAIQKPRRLGTLQGTVLAMSDDFDAPLEDFREYSE